jgi:hypothetical protein
MLTGTLFLIGATFFGIGLVRRLPPLRDVLNHVEQIWWGVVIGWILSTLAAYLVARLTGHLSFGPLLLLTLVFWGIGLLLWIDSIQRVRRVGLRLSTKWRPEYVGLAAVLSLFTPIFVRLFYTHMLEPGPGGVYSGGSTWYDLGFHLTLESSFRYGQNFPPIYPVFPPAPLLYPFLPDFQLSLLTTLGMSLRAALLITSVPLATTITGLFYSFAKRMVIQFEKTSASKIISTRSHVSAVLATAVFLLNGGFGFIYFFEDWRASGKTFAEFVLQLGSNYTYLPDKNIQWTNFIADALLPQRASLFGFAVALMVFTLFVVVWGKGSTDKRNNNRWSGGLLLLIAGILAGLLPWFHAHVYMGLGLCSVFLFLLHARRQWLAFWVPALVLALPYLLNVTGHVTKTSFIRWTPGWLGNNENFWPWYWIRNVGVVAVLIFPAWFAVPAVWRKFYVAFVLLLVFSLLVMVSPNDFDNIKLMYLWYAPTCVLVAAWLVRLATVYRQRVVATTLALLSIASGLLALQHENGAHHLLFSREEMAAADFASRQTSPRSLFLTAPVINQPVLNLAGRAIVRGETAWLWSHGYELAQREADVRAIYAGNDESLELIRYYEIDYVYFGLKEAQLGGRQEFFEHHFPAVYRNSTVTIYDTLNHERGSDAVPLASLAAREFASRVRKDPYQSLVEFPVVGYAVYRLYRLAFRRWPRYEEFMGDMETLGHGLFVDKPGWRELLEINKKALAQKWISGDEFRALYERKSNDQYVDELFVNLAQTPGADQRATLIGALNEGNSRSDILIRISEGAPAQRLDHNTAYVLVHYFAYLHRNPDDLPDKDLTGFNFWLDFLNRTGAYRSLTRAFMESTEYKTRDQKSEVRGQSLEIRPPAVP